MNGLNEQQRIAVETIYGPLLVFAGAGTGKTRVITYRIANMLNKGISPENILAVTFTNKAAQEMRERIASLTDKNTASKITVSTFHALGALLIRENHKHLGLRFPFSIFSTSDCTAIIRKVLSEKMEEWEAGVTPNDLLSMLSKFRLNQFNKKAGYLEISDRILKYIFNFYQTYLRNSNAVDFDDLIYLAIELLQNKDINERYQEKFKYILVDEFQDTNGPQFEIIKLLCGNNKNLCVVGDDDQSIYAFRGSDYKHILNFKNLFTGTKIVKLEQNYRSTQIILDAAFNVIKKNTLRQPKKLWSNVNSSEKIKLMQASDDADEAKQIVSEIYLEILNKKYNYSDICILYRTNTQTRSLEDELMTKKIPYKIIGGTKFYERKEIKDILAYLRVINNPRDEAALYRIINIPARGIGQTSIEKINAYCMKKSITFFQALKDVNNIDTLKPNIKSSIQKFVAIIKYYRDRAKKADLEKLISSLIKEIHYKVEIDRYTKKQEEAEEKYQNVLSLALSARDFQNNPDIQDKSLQGFMERMSLLTDDNNQNKDKDKPENLIKLMTLHNSKGLEFPFVLITGVNETLLPHEKSMLADSQIEEERRLFYVGITRAQKKLVISYMAEKSQYGKSITLKKSRFLDEIPKNCIIDSNAPLSGASLKNLFADMKKQYNVK